MLCLCLLLAGLGGANAFQTEFVFLVTGDGIRHQEIFTGVDANLLLENEKANSGIEDRQSILDLFWDDDPVRRREKLMPFFWKELSRNGVVLGNRSAGSRVDVLNPHHFSYPGYAEILNGQPLPQVTSNDPVWSPRRTVLEFIRRELELPAHKVAVFGSWKILNWITMQRDGELFCNAGYEPMPAEGLSDRMRFWNDAQFQILSPWNTVRHDAITVGLALEYLRAQTPKMMYLSLGETDDWAHDRRYDRTVQSLRFFDGALERLWKLLQAHEMYRGKTTLIVTTDHGRGKTKRDWVSHGKEIPGAAEAWIGIFGPDTPAIGEARNTRNYALANIAATILKFYRLEADRFNPGAADPIEEAFR